MLMTPAGDPAMAWTFRGGIAAKWIGPELNAMQNAVAIEGLEIAHHGIEQVSLSAPNTLLSLILEIT
jgi:phage tail-like protein